MLFLLRRQQHRLFTQTVRERGRERKIDSRYEENGTETQMETSIIISINLDLYLFIL